MSPNSNLPANGNGSLSAVQRWILVLGKLGVSPQERERFVALVTPLHFLGC
jgi:hypothetical protein